MLKDKTTRKRKNKAGSALAGLDSTLNLNYTWDSLQLLLKS